MAVKYGTKPFQEQVDFFRRKLSLGTRGWTDIWQAQHDHAFMVAGAMKADLLEDLRRAVDKAISQGTTLEQFRNDFDAIVQKYGWGYKGGRNWRTRVIYETNLRTSYQAGRYKQMKDIAHRRPYWQYKHSNYVRDPRPEHLSWDGIILRHDDPWWDTHYPPNGWGCRCTVRTLAERDLKKLGKAGPDTAPPVKWQQHIVGKRSGNPQLVRAPVGIDPGWAYAPGQSRWRMNALNAHLKKGLALPPPVAGSMITDTLGRDRALSLLLDDFARWVDEIADKRRGSNTHQVVGALSPEALSALEQMGVAVQSGAIIVRDNELAHMMRDAKVNKLTKTGLPRVLPVDDIKRIPEILRYPLAVYFDTEDEALLYVFDPSEREAGKIVVRVNFTTKLSGQGRQVVNAVRTGGLVNQSSLGQGRYKKIWP